MSWHQDKCRDWRDSAAAESANATSEVRIPVQQMSKWLRWEEAHAANARSDWSRS
jgi:hypothetical protein